MSMEHDKLAREPEVAEFGVEEIDDANDIEEVAGQVEPKFGVVSNCKKLNVRVEPNIESEILCVVDAGDRLMIDPANSDEAWLNVFINAGIEGYCMKEYIEIEE